MRRTTKSIVLFTKLCTGIKTMNHTFLCTGVADRRFAIELVD